MIDRFVSYVGEHWQEILARLGEHVVIVAVAMAVAIPVGVVIGIAVTRRPLRRLEAPFLYLLGLGQTIPSLAILALAITVLPLGAWPAIVAIFLYALLPIARNTSAGIHAVEAPVIDAARGMGMTDQQLLVSVELPLALPFLMAGIRTATAISISAAALAYLVGAGGLGDLIFTGISLFRPEVMLAGAIPTALLALAADWGLARVEAKGRAGGEAKGRRGDEAMRR